MNFKAKIREGSIKPTKIASKFVSCCNKKGSNFFLLPISKVEPCYPASCQIPPIKYWGEVGREGRSLRGAR